MGRIVVRSGWLFHEGVMVADGLRYTRDEIGVNVGFKNAADLPAVRPSRFQVAVNTPVRVDQRSFALAELNQIRAVP